MPNQQPAELRRWVMRQCGRLPAITQILLQAQRAHTHTMTFPCGSAGHAAWHSATGTGIQQRSTAQHIAHLGVVRRLDLVQNLQGAAVNKVDGIVGHRCSRCRIAQRRRCFG